MSDVRHIEAGQRLPAARPLLHRVRRLAAGGVAIHRQAETVLEVEPAYLTVRDDIQANRLLQAKMLLDALQLDGLQFLGAEGAGIEAGPRGFPSVIKKTAPSVDSPGTNLAGARASALAVAAALNLFELMVNAAWRLCS